MRAAAPAWIGAAALLALTSAAQGFETKIHPEITATAMARVGYDVWAISAASAANVATDKDPELFNTPAAHFDDESFAAGSKRLREKLASAMSNLAACNRGGALADMGTSLHSIQDFCSHSNYLELGASPELDFFHLQDPPAGLVCAPPAFATALTTGYWPDTPRKPGKCMHGDLNKDSPDAGARHFAAKDLAVRESVRYLRTVEAEIHKRFQDPDRVVRYLRQGATGDLQDFCPAECRDDASDASGDWGVLRFLRRVFPAVGALL